MLDPALSKRADLASKKSGVRPTSCTGQDVLSSPAARGSGGAESSVMTRVLQIM